MNHITEFESAMAAARDHAIIVAQDTSASAASRVQAVTFMLDHSPKEHIEHVKQFLADEADAINELRKLIHYHQD